MRYDGNLTVEDVASWTKNNFDSHIKVVEFRNNFVAITAKEVVNIRKDCGTVEVKDIM